ncbi:MAG: hypothetical protein EBT64_09905 [Gammaproteobacteria bacterium]|nr:hypothetical protein [Gammaproteobacteria bacterium]
MSSVAQVKTAIASKLGSISGLRTYDRQPDNVNVPMAFPSLRSIEYHGAMGNGMVTHNYDVTVIVGRASERSAETLLDTYLSYGSGGIRWALETDRTLGGTVDTSLVESAGNIQTIDANDTTYLTVDFRFVAQVRG